MARRVRSGSIDTATRGRTHGRPRPLAPTTLQKPLHSKRRPHTEALTKMNQNKDLERLTASGSAVE